MSRGRAADGSVEPEDIEDKRPDAASESPFEAAQGLLAAALDEVRVSRVGDGGAPAPDASTAVRTSRRRSRAAPTTPAPTASERAAETPVRDRPPGRTRARRRAWQRPDAEADSSPIRALEEQADAIRRGTKSPESDLALAAAVDVEDTPTPGPSDEATIPEVAQVVLTASPATSGVPTTRATRAPRAAAHRGTASHRRGATWLLVVAVLAVVVIVGATIVSMSGGDGSDGTSDQGPGPAASPRLAFDPVTTPDGAVVQRVWTLQGAKGGRLVGTLTFRNPTDGELTVSHTEVIPKSLARSVDDIAFDPEPTVVSADPVVEYSLTVPAGGRVSARYEITVAADGARRARLVAWAEDADRASESATTSTTTTTTTTTLAPVTTAAPPPTVLALPGPPPPPPPPPPSAGTGILIVRAVSKIGGTYRYAGPGGSASLATSGSANGTAQSAAIPVGAGVVSWSQVSAPPGSGLVGVSCSGGASVSGATATFEVHAGETVVCTWTNG